MDVRRTLILETIHGSRAYGLATAGSDEDRKGVYVAEPIAFHGYRPWPEQVELSADHVHYDVRKFFALAAACNPTIIELLFTAPEDRTVLTDEGRTLVERRGAFLSRRAGDSFGRYGLSQLRRIKTHRRWLMHPPGKKPERRDFGLPEATVVSRDQIGAAEALLEKGRVAEAELTPNFLEIMDRERRYRAAAREWQQHQEWLAKRNPKRAELEAEHGYDTKHAMHLLRLLRMAGEILTTGEVHVKRPDAGELLAIRRGALSFEELLSEAERRGGALDALAKQSKLPESPDEEALDALCAELVERVHARGGAA